MQSWRQSVHGLADVEHLNYVTMPLADVEDVL